MDGLGINLPALASAGRADTQKRIAGKSSLTKAGLADMLRQNDAGRSATLESQGREQTFARGQSAADDRLARRRQDMQEYMQRVGQQYARLEAERDRDHQKSMQGMENASWYDKQRFQTDENIRQAKALASLDAEAEDPGYLPEDFGASTISPVLGEAIARNDPGARKAFEANVWGASDGVRSRVTKAIQDSAGDPVALEALLREAFGKNTRTASMALFDLGYGLNAGGQ